MENRRYHTLNAGYNQYVVDQRYTNLRPIGGIHNFIIVFNFIHFHKNCFTPLIVYLLILDGSYGFVVSAIDTITNRKVAIKKVKDCFTDVVDAKRILREL